MKHSERGNALFYILLAVALLGGLSFAVTQSNRGGLDQITSEKANLVASELIEYTNTLSAAVTQLKLRGVSDSELCFDDPGWPGGVDYDHTGCDDDYNKVFHTGGAGVFLQAPSADAMDSSASPDNLWHFTGANEIENIGNTCDGVNCVDLIVAVDELNQNTCIELNNKIGITNPSGVPPTDTDITLTAYQGAYSYSTSVGDEAGGTNFKGAQAACFQETGTGKYVFYKVLVAR